MLVSKLSSRLDSASNYISDTLRADGKVVHIAYHEIDAYQNSTYFDYAICSLPLPATYKVKPGVFNIDLDAKLEPNRIHISDDDFLKYKKYRLDFLTWINCLIGLRELLSTKKEEVDIWQQYDEKHAERCLEYLYKYCGFKEK